MKTERHGLSIGIERVNDHFFLTLKAIGRLTHEDYETITPMIDSALATVDHPRVRAVIDGTELTGWTPRAAWDDFRLGLKHNNEFEKIAIVGDKHWQESLSTIARWFVSGQVEFFADMDAALAWLADQG